MVLATWMVWSLASGAVPPAATIIERATTPKGTGTFLFGVGAGGRGAGPPSFESSLDLRLHPRLALRAGVSWEDREASPSVGARLQLLSAAEHGVDVSSSLTFRAHGLEDTGSALELRGTGAKRIGRWWGFLSGMVGQGLGARADVDFEAGAALGRELAGPLSLGIEARVRGEIIDRLVTSEDLGRPVELLAGPTATLLFEPLSVSLLGGYRAPRGTARTGLVFFGTAGVDF